MSVHSAFGSVRLTVRLANLLSTSVSVPMKLLAPKLAIVSTLIVVFALTVTVLPTRSAPSRSTVPAGMLIVVTAAKVVVAAGAQRAGAGERRRRC